MTDNKGSRRADGAEEKNSAKDISEILKMLRDSVGKPVEEKPAEKLDDQVEKKLREKLDDAESSVKNQDEPVENDAVPEESDEEYEEEAIESEVEEEAEDDAPWYSDEESDEEPEEETETEEETEDDAPLYSDEESDEEPEEETETEEETEDDAPWYSDEEPDEETDEESEAEEETEDDAPWYSDEESDEETDEESEAEEETEDDAPWYSDDESDEETEEEPLEIEEIEDSVVDGAVWYGESEGDEAEEDPDDGASPYDEETETEKMNFAPAEVEDIIVDNTTWGGDEAETADEIGETEVDQADDSEMGLTEEEIIESDLSQEGSKWFIDDESDADGSYESENATVEIFENINEATADETEAYRSDDEYAVETEENVEETVEDEPYADELDDNVPDSTFDDEDISLLRSMGYETVVDDNGNDEIVHTKSEPEKESAGAYGYDGGEYVVNDQRDDIIAGYGREKKKTLVRLAITAGATLLLLLYEVLFFSGVTMPWIFNQYENPVAHIMISLQLVIVIVAVSAVQILDGFKSLFTGMATPYSAGGCVAVANMLYTLVIAFICPENFMLFNFLGAFAMLTAVAGEYLLICHEMKSFDSLSDRRVKDRFALEGDDCSGEVLGAPVRALRAYHTEFNKDYFARTGKLPKDMNGLSILIAAVTGTALIAFAVTALLGQVGDALKTCIVIINFAMPLGVICTYSLPIALASHRFIKTKGALIGHSAADEYSDVGFLTFDESDLFRSMKVSRVEFKPSGDMPVAEILEKTGLLFAEIGGPISKTVSLDERRYLYGEVEINGIFDDGLMATVDGCEMLAGSARFLELYGVSVNTSTDSMDSDPTNGILYVSIEGRLAARYYIKYRPDREFVNMVNVLGDMGVAVGLRTHNPAINADIIASRCPEMKYKVYAIKSGNGESDDVTSERNETHSGICANGKAASLAMPFIAAKRLKKIYRADRALRIAAAAIGGVFVLVMVAFGLIHEFNSVQAAIYQTVWMLPSVALGLFFFCRRK